MKFGAFPKILNPIKLNPIKAVIGMEASISGL
jgi:hypothetical protein